jgi:uncharacterized protein YjbI with pentapeptide repeats
VANGQDHPADDNPVPPPQVTPQESSPAIGTNEDLSLRKLQLETLELEQKTSGWSRFLEFLKAAAGIAALAALFVGFLQLRDARRSRDDERFDRAVSRLGSASATERLSGVAGLELFLEPGHSERHRATLRFLVNALSSEKDANVSASIVSSLSRLRPSQVRLGDLNDALEALRDRNRTLYAQHRTVDRVFPTDDWDETYVVRPSSSDELTPLRATAAAMTAMIRNRVKITDLSGIYCVKCDFTGKTWEMMNPNFANVADFANADPATTLDLSGIDFDGAILKGSNFIGVDLRGASFDSADILGVNFAGANLADAKFTDYGHREYFTTSMAIAGQAYPPAFPDFTCADLSGADFTGSVFFGVYGVRQNDSDVAYPILHLANLSNTKLSKMWVYTVSPQLLSANPTPPEIVNSFLFSGSAQAGQFQKIMDSSGTPAIVTVFWGLPSLQMKEPVPSEFKLSVTLAFSNLASARNVQQSQLQQALKNFISRNEKDFSNSPHPTPCTPKS